MGDYHNHFWSFAQGWAGRTLRHPEEWDRANKVSFYRHLGMSQASYRKCKLAYRQGGLKRTMPAFSGARDLTVDVRKRGAQVWVCTTRPYLRLDNIDPDTREFLRRNGIQYDGLLYGEDKYRDLRQIVGQDRVVVVLDDLPEQIRKAQHEGFPTLLKAGPHNAWYESNCCEMKDLHQAREEIIKMLSIWKKENK